MNSSIPNENLGGTPCKICEKFAYCTPDEIFELLTEENINQTAELHSQEIIKKL